MKNQVGSQPAKIRVRLKQDLLEISEPGDVVWYGSSSHLGRGWRKFTHSKRYALEKVRLFERSENRYLDFASSAGDRLSEQESREPHR